MAVDHELRGKARAKVAQADVDGAWDRDASQLSRLGKRPVLKVCA